MTVATSDALEQVIILGHGAARMSALGLKRKWSLRFWKFRREHLGKAENDRNYLFDYLTKEDARQLEKKSGWERCPAKQEKDDYEI